MVYLVYDYIEKKDNRLYCEISQSIEEAFNKYCESNYPFPPYFIDDSYANRTVSYKEIRVPYPPKTKKNDELSKYIYDEWYKLFGGIKKMYKLNYDISTDENRFIEENGWCLAQKSTHGDNIYVELIFPYAVGFYAPDSYFGYEYFPSVEEAVNEAYDFFTANNKNKLQKYNKGTNDKIIDEIILSNEYYLIAEGANQYGDISKIGGMPLFCESDTIPFFDKIMKAHKSTPKIYEYTYMYNGYYKVYIAKSQPIAYSIQKFNWNPDECERNELLIKWAIIISGIFILIEIGLIVSEVKRRKRLKEPIYDKLMRICNPGNFLKPQDPKKFEIATEIYKKIQEITRNDIKELDEIQKVVVKELGINLIDKEERMSLLKRINPKKWMNPYNEEKMKLANDLYVRMNATDLTWSEFEEIKKRAKDL